MPSSCPNGIRTSGKNDVGKTATRTTAPDHYKTSHEKKQNASKATRGLKASRGQNKCKPDGTQSTDRRNSVDQLNTHSVQTLADQVVFATVSDSTISTDALLSDPRQASATSTDLETTMSNSPTKPSTMVVPNAVTPTVYDPNLVQPYVTQVQGYIPGYPCSAPHCTTCYPVLDSMNYVNNANSANVQQPMLLNRSVLGGVGSSGATGTAPNPCYVFVGRDTDAQKQLYQAQLALSQLSINSATTGMVPNYGVPQDCPTGIPLVQQTPTVETATGTGQLLTSSPASDASLYTTTSLVMPYGAVAANNLQSRAVSESRFPCAPHPTTIGNSANYPNCNSMGNQGVGLCVDATNIDNTMWTGNYLPTAAAAAAVSGTGTENLWIHSAYPSYAQQYYQALSVPVASISSSGMVNYEDPNSMPQTSVDRSYSNPAISIGDKYPSGSQEYFCSPGTSLSSSSIITGPAKISGPKTYAPFSMLSPASSVFSQAAAQPQVNAGAGSTNWQMLWSAFAAQRNNQSANSNWLRYPLSSYNLSLDRARLSGGRKRMPINFSARPLLCKEFNPDELQSLNLGVNPVEFDTSLLFRARYFVIKSDCEYNVHQSIRHGVWCSTRSGNECLNAAYKSLQATDDMSFSNNSGSEIELSQSDRLNSVNSGELSKSNGQLRGHIILFFFVRSSGYLNGVAEMIGPVDPQKRCTIWSDSRFRGRMPVRWLYVKNVPSNLMKDISIEAYDNRPVTTLRDTSEITPSSKGEELLRIVHEFKTPGSRCTQHNYY